MLISSIWLNQIKPIATQLNSTQQHPVQSIPRFAVLVHQECLHHNRSESWKVHRRCCHHEIRARFSLRHQKRPFPSPTTLFCRVGPNHPSISCNQRLFPLIHFISKFSPWSGSPAITVTVRVSKPTLNQQPQINGRLWSGITCLQMKGKLGRINPSFPARLRLTPPVPSVVASLSPARKRVTLSIVIGQFSGTELWTNRKLGIVDMSFKFHLIKTLHVGSRFPRHPRPRLHTGETYPFASPL